MNKGGYRGYIASRPIFGQRTPQHVQNLVVRDAARRRNLTFHLSATEYAMPGCYMVLEEVLNELPQLDGLICFSLFMLPQRRERRRQVWQRVLDNGCTLVAALEGLTVADERDIARAEDLWLVQRLLPIVGIPSP